jgi:hypothetical protein
VTTPELRRKRHNVSTDPVRWGQEDWQTFWSDGPSARDYVLLRFARERVEVLSFPAGIAPAPYGLCAAAEVRHGGGWQLAVG